MLRFEKIGDINTKYPYLEVFRDQSKSPMVEVSVSDSQEILFRFLLSKEDLIFSYEELKVLLEKAEEFRVQAIKDEDDFERRFGEMED